MGILILSSCLTTIINIERLFGRVEIFEIILLFTFSFYIWKIPNSILLNQIKKLNHLDQLLLTLLLIYTFNVFYHFTKSGIFDLITLYLLAISYLVISRSYLLGVNSKDLSTWYKYAIILTFITSVIGYICYFWTSEMNITLDQYPNYPYFGNIYRSQGLTINPNSLSVLISLYIIFTLSLLEFNTKSFYYILLSIITITLTLTKEMVLIWFVFFIFLLIKFFEKKNLKLLNLLGIIFLLFYIFSINFVLCYEDCFDKTWSLGPSIVQINENLHLRPTGYYFLSKVEFYFFSNHPIMGIGFGNVQHFIMNLSNDMIYPTYMPPLESHTLLSGILAQFGYFSLLIILTVVIYSKRLFKDIILLKNKNLLFIFFTTFWVLIYASFGLVDFLFNRHVWISLGTLSLLYNEQYFKTSQLQ